MRACLAAWMVVLRLGAPSAATAQVERGELQLFVSDATGLPLIAAGTLASEAPQLFRSFSTDDRGRFTLQNLPFGVYRLFVERSGFATYSDVVDIRSAVPKSLQISLVLAPVTSQVDVTADPPLVDASRTGVTFSISAPQIQDRLPSVPGRRLLDLVDAQPGWLMEANGVLHPRGSEYQTLFVIDGVPMDENRSPAFAPDLQDGEVQAITVLTGNFPAEYGRKLGGVVEVSTVRDIQTGFHGSADGGGGRFGMATGSFSATQGWRRRALTASGSGARTNRYLDPPVVENFTNHGSLGGFSVSYEDRPTDSDRLHFTTHHRETTFLVPNEIVQEEAGQRQTRTGREDLGQASWTHIFGSRLVLNARAVVERIEGTLRSNAESTPIAVTQDRSLERRYANLSVAADRGRHQLKAGGDLVFSPVTEQLVYLITDRSFFSLETPPQFQFSDAGTDREQSLFAQDTMSAGPFTISAGLRWDRYDFVVTDSAFSPRLGVAWSAPGGQLVLRASYDRVFQTPAVENLLLASSPVSETVNPVSLRLPVEPSRGHFVEGGLTAGIGRKSRFDVTAYRRTVKNFADDDVFLNTGVSFPVAFASADIRGVDAKLTMLPWRRASGSVSYALLRGTARLPIVGGLFLGEEALDALEADGELPITQDQRHTFRGQLRYDVAARFWVNAAARFGSGLPVELDEETGEDELLEQYGQNILERVDLETGRVRSNFAVDAGFGARLWRRDQRRLTVRAELANLTNRLNVINFAGLFSGTALAPPRSATLRLQFEF